MRKTTFLGLAAAAVSILAQPDAGTFGRGAASAANRVESPVVRDTRDAIVQARASAAAGTACLMATDFFRVYPPAHIAPAHLYDLNPNTGTATSPRTTNAPALIGLAWARDGYLYGVSPFGAQSPYQPNALYRIDPATGATLLIGPIGLQSVDEGDLATNPITGEIFGTMAYVTGMAGNAIFRFPGQSPHTAQIVGAVVYPYPNAHWDINGLAFDPAGHLYALAQSQGLSGPPAHLLTLDPANGNVVGDVALSFRIHEVGGLEFAGGRLFYADGNEPGAGQGASPNNLYSLFEINPSTGAMTVIGSTNIPAGVASLVSCTSPLPPVCVAPPPDMDAWYPMDGDGTDLILGKNAAVTGAMGFPSGKVDRYADFQGGYMTVPNGPVLNEGKGDFSIDAWVNAAFGPSSTFYILDKRTLNTSVQGWSLMVLNGHLLLQLADGGFGNYVDSRIIPPLAWRHIAVTIDRDNPQGIVFYIDGVAGTPLDPRLRQGNLDNNSPTYIGRHANGGVSTNIGLDEIELFDRVLAPGEVASIFNAGVAGKCK